MLDNLELLQSNPQLLELFRHYARLAEPNAEAWQPRLAHLQDEQADLVKLHGELIAFDLIDQNTGKMPCSYRLTRAGLRAFKQLMNSADDEPDSLPIVDQAA